MTAGQSGTSDEAYRARIPALIPWTRPVSLHRRGG